jgi:TonB family protein
MQIPASSRFVACAALCLCLLAGDARAEDPAALAARLHATSAASSIDTPGLVPWHLKMDVQLFDEKGKPTEQGTIEEWWASGEQSRVTYAMPSYTVTKLHNKDGFFQTKATTYEPSILDDLLNQIVHPVLHESEIDDAKPDLRKQTFGKVPMDCIMLDQPLKNVAFPPLGLFTTFCLEHDKNDLRITTELGSLTFIRNTMGVFQGRSVTTLVSGNVNDITVVTGRVNTLATMKFSDADFAATADMEPTAEHAIRVGAGVIAGQLLTQVQPIYPLIAKQNHISGTVILHAIIGRDGRIATLHIVSTPDASLAMAAVNAVKKWTYKPYLLNGEPADVDTTVNVNFMMSN